MPGRAPRYPTLVTSATHSKPDFGVPADSLPQVPEQLLKSWQAGIDSLAEILAIPAALVTRRIGRRTEVFLGSASGGNPYRPGDPWRSPPDLKFGLLAQLGFPLRLPDGREFGSVWVLDGEPRVFTEAEQRLVGNIRTLIEGQLSLLTFDRARVMERTQQLRRSTELLQAVMDGATDAIFLKDTEGTFLIFNQAAASFIARPAAEVLGKTADEVFGATAGKVLRDRELAVLSTGVATTVEETIVGDGQVRTFLTTRSVQRDEHGTIIGLIGIARNITAMKQAEAALRDSEARWQFAVDSAGDGIWDWNVASGKVFYSRQCKASLGYADEEFGDSMKDWTDKVHPLDLPVIWQGIQDHLEGKTADFVAEQRMRTRMGSWRWILVRGKVIERHADQSAVRVIATQTDITARKMAEEELKRSYEALRQAAGALRTARDEAQAAEHAKGDFLAAMSHEIRTPMNTVIGMTRLALTTELTVRQRNYLEKIDSAARSLLNIINDVLDFSKIEAGGLTLEDTDFDLDLVLDSASTMTAMKAEEKGLEMIYAVAQDVPRVLRGDPLRLGQVLINLLSNAVKFTPQGEVLVSINAQKILSDRVTLQFCVKDTGIGLEPGQINGLFRAFSQLGPHISRKYGGTGLGLAICRQLVELMGGRIWAEGEPGSGSRFHFTVDMALPRARHTGDAAAQPPTLAPRRVLIADDNLHSREVLADSLAGMGLAPTLVASGTEALIELQAAAQRSQNYELALVDWDMPGLDGIETASRIRADRDLTRLPTVLMVTGFGREETLRSAEQLGLAGVLVKPVTRSLLFSTIAKIFEVPLSADGETRPARTAAMSRGLRIPREAVGILAGRSILVVDDNGLNREVVTDLLRAVDMKVDTATTGQEAIEKIRLGQFEVVLMDVHMPGMDGLTATRRIRAQPRFAKLPIIALTAQVLAAEREATLAAGMNAYLTKPIDEALLYATLMDMLRPPVAFSLARLGSDPARLRVLLGDFLRDTAAAPENLIRQVDSGELQQAAALVHFIRGAAFYMQATTLCEAAGRFEAAARQADAMLARATLADFISALAPLREYLSAQLGLIDLTLHPPGAADNPVPLQ